jgi:CRP-like cAMP-binding protein
LLELVKRAIRETVRQQAVRAHVEGTRRYRTSRRIDPQHETTFRLCHHDFCGLNQADAAEVSGLSQQTVSRVLTELRQQAPQLFPILSPRTARMYAMFQDGNTCQEIAEALDVTPRAVQKAMHRLMDEGQLYFRSGARRRLSYRPWQDEYIREKF